MTDFETYLEKTGEIGFVESVNNTIIAVSGLPHASPQEIVILESGERGSILGLHKDFCDILLFSKTTIKAGTRVARTNNVLSIPAGQHLLGKTVDPFGKALDASVVFDKKEIEYIPIESSPPGIGSRKRISKTFETGVALVDLILPLGKGQRELIIGDRKTGKTYFLLQTILTQASADTVCIYVGIGKKELSIKKIEEFVRVHQIADKCVIVASSADDAPGITYIAPYTGMTIAEYFRKQGKDVLIILDDLSTHARYYRQISLIMKRFPGRNSYPADVFYAHARLLERAGNFLHGENNEDEKSITCLAVAETVQGDLSGYIQTNLMSITDGHLYFDVDLFGKGRRPPIHPFLSVTRIGRQTQTTLRQTLNREILSFLSLYEKMQNFSHFGSEVNESIGDTLKTGKKVDTFFDQISSLVIPLNLQLLLFSLLWTGSWSEKEIEIMKSDMERIIKLYKDDAGLQKEVMETIEKSETFNHLLGQLRGKGDAFYQKLGIS